MLSQFEPIQVCMQNIFALILLAIFSFACPPVKAGKGIYQAKKRKCKKKKRNKCKDNEDFEPLSKLSVSPLDLENGNLTYIVPLGNLNPSGHTFPTRHTYWHLPREVDGDFSTPSARVDVRAPGDITIDRIEDNVITDEITIYSIKFSLSKEVKAYFLHVTSLADKLQSAFDSKKQCSNGRCDANNLDLAASAGEVIGTAGGDMYNNQLDMGMVDHRNKKMLFANKSRWLHDDTHSHYQYIVCPLDYFEDGLKETLYTYLGNYSEPRTIEPICGKVNFYEKNSIAGIWYKPKTSSTYPEDPHLALGIDNIDPNFGKFSIGTHASNAGIDVGTYYFNPENTALVNRTFVNVKDNDIYCYEVNPGTFGPSIDTSQNISFLLQLKKNGKLKLDLNPQTNCGTGPWDISDSAPEYER